MKRLHVFIYGDVIGVGYRAWTVRNARVLGLTGWVKNEAPKKVEALFEGEEENLKEMLKKCKMGPEVSWVERIEEEWREETGEFLGFEIKY